MKIILCYLPVLHEGYYRFFQKHSDADALCVLGKSFLSEKPLSKDIRALDPALAAKAVSGWGIFSDIRVVEEEGLSTLDSSENEILFPNDVLSRELAGQFSEAQCSFEDIFLRWDKHKAMEMKPVDIDQSISEDDFHAQILSSLKSSAESKSSDIWRRVGAALIKDGDIILETYNAHLPSEHAHLVSGDPRSNFSKGICVELSSALHAEAGLIAEAAKRGISLEGADMYVSTFPCPPCAKTISHTGIKRLFYSGGYGVLDGADVLKAEGVEIVYVEVVAS